MNVRKNFLRMIRVWMLAVTLFAAGHLLFGTNYVYTVKAAQKSQINISKTVSVKVGKTLGLELAGKPTNVSVKWTISARKDSNKKTKAAKIVNKGTSAVKIKGLKKGTCYLRGKMDGNYYVCKVKVKKPAAKKTQTVKETASKTTTTTTTSTSTAPKAASYTDYELYLLSHLINGEAGCNWCTDAEQRAVGSVVLNRMRDSRFPSSMEGVIYQSGQYACTWDGNFYLTPSQRAIDNAKYLLQYGSTLPSGVVFQSQSIQGSIYSKIGVHYFCY